VIPNVFLIPQRTPAPNPPPPKYYRAHLSRRERDAMRSRKNKCKLCRSEEHDRRNCPQRETRLAVPTSRICPECYNLPERRPTNGQRCRGCGEQYAREQLSAVDFLSHQQPEIL
jgi:hypothetical protein